MRKFYIIIFIFLFIITNKVNAIESSNYIALGFADNLYEQGDYYRAVTEYHRYLCFYPYGSSRDYALYKLGLCYRENGEYNSPIQIVMRHEAAGGRRYRQGDIAIELLSPQDSFIVGSLADRGEMVVQKGFRRSRNQRASDAPKQKAQSVEIEIPGSEKPCQKTQGLDQRSDDEHSPAVPIVRERARRNLEYQ